MLEFLKNHPFAVEAFFDSSLVLTYAVPKEQIAHLIPECLTLDTFEDKWAFIAVAIVQTRKLRPKGFPKILGNDFVLTGYRIFVRYTTSAGKRLRGLFIIKSETDQKRMQILGNTFTHYNYTTTDIAIKKDIGHISVLSKKSQLNIEVNADRLPIVLPDASPFPDWKTARRFAGPLPFTFTFNDKTNEVLIIEGIREHWEPKPVSVITAEVGYIQSLNIGQIVLANAFLIEDIPYYWKKGRIDKWQA